MGTGENDIAMSEVRELSPVLDNPEDAGAAHQKAGSKNLLSNVPTEGLSIVGETLTGLAASNHKSLGGIVVSQILAATYNEMAIDLRDTRAELRKAQRKCEDTSEKLAKCQKQEAVLQTRINDMSSHHRLQNVLNAGGVLLMGVAWECFQRNIPELALFLAILGGVFIFFSWWQKPEEKK